MNGFTRVFLLGYLGSNLELQKSKKGLSFTKMSVSTHKSRLQEDGKWNTTTEWHRVIVWGSRAEKCVQKLAKGSPVAVEGRIETYKMEREGGVSNQVSIVAEHVHFLPNPKQQTMAFVEEDSVTPHESQDLSELATMSA